MGSAAWREGAILAALGATACCVLCAAFTLGWRHGRMEKLGHLGAMRSAAVRLAPGDEVKTALLTLAKQRKMKAGVIVTCVGSCDGATIRLAAATAETAENEICRVEGKHEIVSLVGTISEDGACHLHVSLADAEGKVIGGHLVGDMKVFTTAEVVIGECEGLCWDRKMDERTGFRELVVCKSG